MKILNDFNTSVEKALEEIDPKWRDYEGLIICGTHSPHDVEEYIKQIEETRLSHTPFLGICFGHQLAAIEYARNVLGIKNATSEEFNVPGNPVVIKLSELNVGLKSDGESYWNNYTVIPLVLGAWGKSDNFITCQYHPEYQSSKDKPHPLLSKFIEVCKNQERNNSWQCLWSPTLGELEDTSQNVWGTKDYLDINSPTVFFGLYGFPDFYTLWRHKGRKAILWAGSDILQFLDGYWLDNKGSIKISPRPLATWINKNCENYVENEIEQGALKSIGIESKIVPSFLGNIENYGIEFKTSDTIKLYTSVSGNDFKRYGWDKIPHLAEKNPSIEFHLYGNTKEPFINYNKNVIIHGRISKEQMNDEIKGMTGALRLTEFDGFSEIIAKSLLWGQWPVSIIEYPHTLKSDNIDMIKIAREPNIKGRDWLLSVVNKYPWNEKLNKKERS